MIDLFIPSIHDANTIFTQQIALEFIAKFTKKTNSFSGSGYFNELFFATYRRRLIF